MIASSKYLRVLLYICVLAPLLSAAHPGQPVFKTTEDGVIIYPDENFSGHTQALRLQIITDNIVRVIASPQKDFPVKNSLVTVYKTDVLPKWDLVPGSDKENVTLKTKSL